VAVAALVVVAMTVLMVRVLPVGVEQAVPASTDEDGRIITPDESLPGELELPSSEQYEVTGVVINSTNEQLTLELDGQRTEIFAQSKRSPLQKYEVGKEVTITYYVRQDGQYYYKPPGIND
jgi:hypothetical protein